ncbi:uracil-DNA glycosylase family protein [Cupriavidus sp. 2SB]|uniref:uracil-DNA glycosylase family protein n=1 Tax=Cupriavidus sp. 2SB TaxID=2502199 RepID=UPI0020173B19|nr:uracil-DNA glycosylase family protein [Cupriavidus sp. 2SB]
MNSPHPAMGAVEALRREIAACTRCAADLAAGPRPVVQFSATSRIVIIGQAPGARVHASGIPFDDPSGDRLRDWMGTAKDTFYDASRIAIVPMGFCYPGKGASGDLPPRRECAPLWHERVLGCLPADRLTLLVGTYAQNYYLPTDHTQTMTSRVADFRRFGPNVLPLPHPSWRVVGWMRQNPWFEAELLPMLQAAVAARIDFREIAAPRA